MLAKRRTNSSNSGDYFRPEVLVNNGLVVLSDEELARIDNLDNVVLTYASKAEPVAVHGFDKEANKRLDTIVGYRIWVIQDGDPFQVVVRQTNLPEMVYGVTQFKLKNLRGYYFRRERKHFYKADSLEPVDFDEVEQ